MVETHTPRPIEPADLFRIKYLQTAQLSPDGQTAAYAVSWVDAEKEEEHVAIWLVPTAGGEPRQLTAGTSRDWNPQWSPDGQQIAFLSTRDGRPQIYLIPVAGGEARALTALKQGVGGGPVWSPDGTRIAFTAGPAREPRDPNKPYRITRAVYRFDGMGYIDDLIQDIYLVPAAGGEPQLLVGGDYMKGGLAWSPDGQEILFTASMFPDSQKLKVALQVTDMAGTVRELVNEWGSVSSAAWLPDGQRIAIIGGPEGRPIGSKSDLWLIDKQGGTPECRTASLKYGLGGLLRSDIPVAHPVMNILITPDGEQAYVEVQIGGTMHTYRVALGGPEAWAPVLEGDRWAVAQDLKAGRLLFTHGTMHVAGELHVADLDGANERPLTQINSALEAQWKLPAVEHLLFPSSDGEQVEGWIMIPPIGQAPYPTVLYIHGGPHGAFGHAFHFDFQMLAGAGYAVLFINHRASTGYGDGFSTAIKGDWGHLDYDDLMAGVDYAIARGIADADRLGVAGISGGGNLSCWIVGQTDRFKAAVPENPVTNFVTMYGVADMGVGFCYEELGGHPHEIPEVYRRCSPITYAHRCKTPTLLIQGESDYRCPAEQSEQFYAALKASGCTVEMLRLPNSPHVGSIAGAPIIRQAQNEALLEWMNRYVLGKET